MSSGANERLDRALLSLDGLAIGDALGEMLSYRCEQTEDILRRDLLPNGPWFHTDDTEMALSIVEVLAACGRMEQDMLAELFARRFEIDQDRGYGKMTRMQLRAMLSGEPWQRTATSAFGGQGSMGNGAAMRVAPLGAYFADDLERVVMEAEASSVVTHMHREGVAGAIAVAVAAASAWQMHGQLSDDSPGHMFATVLAHTPDSEVKRGLSEGAMIPASVSISQAATQLGNGSLVTAPDTVPFAIWRAARHLGNFESAVINTIAGDGDCDTNAAIVGGIVALSAGRESIPTRWLEEMEKLSLQTKQKSIPK